jgi:hypothetical protein
MTPRVLHQLRRLLCRLQDELRVTVIRSRRRGSTRLSRVAAVTAADTIYAVDRVSERRILAWFARHWPASQPVELVMEGLEDGVPVPFPRGTPAAATKWKCLLDPIDGTRGLMYDKRSAWSLAGLAPQRGAATHLGDIVVAAMTELPTSKAGAADQFSAVRGRGLKAERIDLRTGRRRRIQPRPSRASGVEHGFASFVKFFPEGKAALAALEEKLWRRLEAGDARHGRAIFDDQYLSTGGQLHELLAGHDRFVADLRPLVARAGALTCHPYDICTLLLAEESGCIITAPGGGPLLAPLDTVTPVAWVGYANRRLQRRIAPVLHRLLRGA